MPVAFGGKMTGVAAFKRSWKGRAGQATKLGAAASDRLLWAMWKRAIGNCPVYTGRLAKTIRVEKLSPEIGFVLAGHGFGSDTFYAHFVEFGPRPHGVPPDPFMQRTADEFKSVSGNMKIIKPKPLFRDVFVKG